MKMKKKILLIWMVLLLFAIPYSYTKASDTQTNEQGNETGSLKLVAIGGK